ncbi:J domain-containing protein [Desulfohalobium retbaense]|uniref:Heat shock protein DnaJ domain protein n=1 Tax=Desulfohalobium retbaense (strain ATCC 49708 / DSM 5692 / JCM 16813 / HR100) TaxID=485915 RepID=C8X3Z6_DESRD|nr:J domain-containing protein [Desulfohalobium retbaense]ACV69143.1 heat shock protein DnaJ domain protein [Desulfohalobium retbaense DSM 5692]
MLADTTYIQLAAEVLGVEPTASPRQIQYGYYRMMHHHHPDKHRGDARATRFAALINEAKNVLLGEEAHPSLLKDRELIAALLQRPVAAEDVLSYEAWLRSRFYDMEQCSIWPC